MRGLALALAATAATTTACTAQLGPDVTLGDPVSCPAPTEGFDRLEEDGADRGIDLQLELRLDQGHGCNYIPGAVVASDLDGDGDVDLAFGNVDGFPFLFDNDGDGDFSGAPAPSPAEAGLVALDRAWLAVGAVDLDGDDLPELLLSGDGIVAVLRNLGGFDFAAPDVAWQQEEWPRDCVQTISWGDADGDGDLDLVAPTLDQVEFEGWVADSIFPDVGSPDRLLLQEDDGSFGAPIELLPASGEPWLSLLAHFTDRDADGDLDLLVGSDRALQGGAPARFFRNDGPGGGAAPAFVDDGPEVGGDTFIDAMGLDVRDLNEDGLPDYCMTDIGDAVRCLLSGDGQYVVAGTAQGLVTDAQGAPEWQPNDTWSAWSLQFLDIDNDGRLDAAAAAGEPTDFGSVLAASYEQAQPDTLWQGQEDSSFVVRGQELGFDDPAHHYGLVAADLAGDGFAELVVGVAEGRPLVWNNPCGDGAWLQVDLVGPPGNRDGFGATVVIEAAGRAELQEVLALRTVGQAPPLLHFGLGEVETVDSLRVTWPDGHVSEASRLPTRRVVTVAHPDAG